MAKRATGFPDGPATNTEPLPAPFPRARDRLAAMNLARGRELGIADKVSQMTYRLSNPLASGTRASASGAARRRRAR